MTKITATDVKKIASLARIEVLDEEKENLVNQLGKIISWVETLNEVNTTNTEPLINVHNMPLKLHVDGILQENNCDEILKNSKSAKYNYYTVPKVIE
jgi:aspartyl-tRNA(Asn)/glutamyl-tRNA(Gln) amidotransferase subunit C